MKQKIIDNAFDIMKIVGDESFKDKPLENEDAVILALMHTIISNCNDINFLLENKRYDSIEIISRSILEKSISLKYLLKEDTKRRCTAYFSSFKKQTAEKLKKTIENISNLKDKEEILRYANSSEHMRSEVPNIKSFDEYIKYYQDLYNKQFNSNVNKNQRRNWYNLNGNINNMLELMKYVGKDEKEYYFFYGLESLHIHGLSSVGNLKMKDNSLLFGSAININLLDDKLSNYIIENILSVVKYYKLNKNNKVKNKLALMNINFNFQTRESI